MRIVLALTLTAALAACGTQPPPVDDGELTVALSNAIGWHPYLNADSNVLRFVEYDMSVTNATRSDLVGFGAGNVATFIASDVNWTDRVTITVEDCPAVIEAGSSADCVLVVDWWVTKDPRTGSDVDVYFWWQGRSVLASYKGPVTLVDGPY